MEKSSVTVTSCHDRRRDLNTETLGTVSTFSVPEQGQTLGKHWERLAASEIVGR